ncbi:MAG: hypothetical protein V1842_04615 [Candidatus Omnitrophota bacterium]|nr:hypothetical protein [Candidatus Omnitrophota bacterium]MBU1928339.1 hypothetical protein [Candidatus Omnitrophota bacterium]MBU2034344.1 hypothetical protein [Candidatus Omnitrophota bacterium]MBU2222341.1 hypothetical protein [Candidatus Omnitrophota bacterium]MBU2258451.1 hypothetical protein [Candidatus Omnitrophota bacterium]
MLTIKLSFYILSLVSLIVGIFLAFNPELSINLQIKFYALINWKVEPISIPKEIRNTRAMGIFLLALLLIYVFYSINQRLIP